MRPARPQRSGSSPKWIAYARIAASTESMCFLRDSLAVNSSMSASASARGGRGGIHQIYGRGGDRRPAEMPIAERHGHRLTDTETAARIPFDDRRSGRHDLRPE